MTRRIVSAEAVDLERAGRRDYYVELEHDSIWGSHLIPLTVVVGEAAEPGRGLVVFGSTHGDEYEGPVVIKNLLHDLDTLAVSGRIVLVPVLNPAAFWAGAREATADDGVNLNRAFLPVERLATLPATVSYRIVDFVRRTIWPHVDIVLDLHAGGQLGRFMPCTSFHPLANRQQSRRTERLARAFGTPLVLVYQNQTPGLLTSEAEKLGKITVGTELGWGNAIQAGGVAFGRRGVIAAAALSGQIHHRDGSAWPPPAQQIKAEIVERACYVTSPVSGHFEPKTTCGALVEAGEILGLIHDFERIDTDPLPITSELSGVLVAHAWNARVRQGQHVAVTGSLIPWDDDGIDLDED